MEAVFETIKKQRSENHPLAGMKYFFILFIFWVIAGGIGLILEKERFIYRTINEQHSPFLDSLLPYVTHMGEATFIIIGLLLLLLHPSFRKPRLILALVCCNIVPFLLTQAIKSMVNAPRPLKYYLEAAWINRVNGQPINYDYSFPSGHSEGAFAFFCFLALLLPSRYASLGIIFFGLAMAVGYSRIYLSQHFYADVYVGSIVGTLSCMLVFRLINPLGKRIPA